MIDSGLMIKAKWVADMMAADGVKPDQVTEDLALAYMDAISRKIEQIQSTYLTRNGAKESMKNAVMAIM